jgi:hypothetical protein
MDDNVLVPALEGVNFPGTQEEHRISQSSQDSVAIDSKYGFFQAVTYCSDF